MNAPSTTPSRQSLKSKCTVSRHELLQQFARAEKLMARKIGPDAPQTFGKKLTTISKVMKLSSEWQSLNKERNLIAHAFVDYAELDDEWVSIWTVADFNDGLNSSTMNSTDLKIWGDRLEKTLTAFCKALKA